MPLASFTKQPPVTAPRYRRSSVRAVLETLTQDHNAASEAHDALWAALWNRRFDDIDQPIWATDAVYGGIVAFTRDFPEGTSLTGIDTNDAFLVFHGLQHVPPVGSLVRVLPAGLAEWRFADGTHAMGLGVDLRFDDHLTGTDVGWVAVLREGLNFVTHALEVRREQLTASRATLGAANEPSPLEDIWREEVSAISDRVMLETEYTEAERREMQKARAKGERFAEEAERKIFEARRTRFSERRNEEFARFREERWPAIRDAAITEIRKYNEYRSEVVRLEDGLNRLRALSERAAKAGALLDKVEAAGLSVRKIDTDLARRSEPGYAEELLRTIELLHGAIPHRAQSVATSFSAYRAPTVGPSIIPPRI